MSNRIIITYLAKEVAKASLATILVLTIIMVSNALGRVLAEIADGGLPANAMWPAMLAQSVSLLSRIMPVGLFFGIIFAFGRLGKDHELLVMHACGVGYRHFYLAVSMVALPLLLISIVLSLWVNAEVLRHAKVIIEQAGDSHEFSGFRAGQFNQSGGSDGVFYMESISDDLTELKEVVIGNYEDGTMSLQTGERGRNKIDETTGDLFLEIGPGERFEGVAGDADFRIISFATHGILLEQKTRERAQTLDRHEMTLTQLYGSESLRDRIELHWRVNLPVALLVLAVLAVPLSYLAPRQGRFGKVGYALLTYIVYLNLVAISRAQMEDGSLPLWIGFWWVHLLFLSIALFMVHRRNRGFSLARS